LEAASTWGLVFLCHAIVRLVDGKVVAVNYTGDTTT